MILKNHVMYVDYLLPASGKTQHGDVVKSLFSIFKAEDAGRGKYL